MVAVLTERRRINQAEVEKQPKKKRKFLSCCKCDRKTLQCVNQGRKVTRFIFKEIALNYEVPSCWNFPVLDLLFAGFPLFLGFLPYFDVANFP